jgi:hypothetical protein
MKKITLLTVVLAGLAFASCKKDYTCKCTVVSTTAAVSVTTTSSGATGKMKKKDAEAKCNEGDSSTSLLGTSVVSTCEIE